MYIWNRKYLQTKLSKNKMNSTGFIKRINALSKKYEKLVVAIDGYSAAGKTTLLKKFEKDNKNVLAVFMDDFILTGKGRGQSIKKAKDKSKVFELDWYDYKKIKTLIKEFRAKNKGYYKTKIYNSDTDKIDILKKFDLSKNILVIEGIFLFHPKLFKNMFDIKVFLDIGLAYADKRRVRRERKRWGKEYISEDSPNSWTNLFKIAYKRYLKEYSPKKQADIVIKTTKGE